MAHFKPCVFLSVTLHYYSNMKQSHLVTLCLDPIFLLLYNNAMIYSTARPSGLRTLVYLEHSHFHFKR